MISKADWQAVHDTMTADDRRKLGEPPTAEEVIAYSNGELDAADEARVRELLVAYPEMARALAHPFPEDAADALPAGEVEARWREFERRVAPPRTGHVLEFWRASAAIAAALAVLFGGLLWRAQSELKRPRVAAEEQLLYPGLQRGAADSVTTIAVNGDPVPLVVMLGGADDFRDYRLELVKANTTLWRSEVLHRGERDTFQILVPRALLEPGRYDVVLHGVDGTREERVAVYPMRVR